MTSFERQNEESIEARRERLRPLSEASLRVFESTEPLENGLVQVMRKRGERIETIRDVIVCGINDDGLELCGIEADGGPSASATMLWSEIVDIQK